MFRYQTSLIRLTFCVIGLLALGSCSPFGGVLDLASVCEAVTADGTQSMTVSWNPNKEVDVNKAGGGYRIYYALKPNVDTGCSFVDVPYVSGATAPTTGSVPNLQPGTYYVRVLGYSSFNPNSIPAGNLGAVSSEVSVVISP